MSTESPVATFLFTDLEGSTRLWEQQPDAMRAALAWHDRLSREVVAAQGGRIVKTTGDGIHAVFDQAAAGVAAALELQRVLQSDESRFGVPLRVRAGLHAGPSEGRDGDFYGPVLNRAARLMSVAHGGQVLLSQAVADAARRHLPAPASLRDLGRVRLRDLTAPEQVHQLVHPALRSDFPPLRSLEATPNNLSQQLNSFVGRETELAQVRSALQATRLLTLLGMGGLGKSRLSVQLGAELLDEYADGVWLVELAPLADSHLVPQALASVLGVREAAGQDLVQALLAHLRDRTLLVILDNCEHLLAACADLAKRLMQAAPGLRLLATSRDALQVAGESVYAVPTLRVPQHGPAVDVDALRQHEAVRLFVDRAQAAQPAFRLDAASAGAVAEICRQLDGIPLALELAAARTRSLTVQTIAERLRDRFRLLVSGDRTVLPRQRTLRALIDWSYDLLDAPERTLFARLSVFAGGCTLPAAEAVGAGDGLDPLDVLDQLSRLVEKSLVALDPAQGRYRMLETVRAYASECLARQGDEAATQRRHVQQVATLAEQAWVHVGGPEQEAWLQRVDAERDNLLAVLDWCGRDAECGATGLQMLFWLRTYWIIRGLVGLGHSLTVRALAWPAAQGSTAARSRVLVDAGQLSLVLGRQAEALDYLQDSRRIAEALDDRRRLAAVLLPLGLVLANLQRGDDSRQVFEQAAALADEVGNQRQLAVALNGLAQGWRAAGRLEQADAQYLRVQRIAQELEDRESCAIALLNRAMVAVLRRDLPLARTLLCEVAALSAQAASEPVLLSLFDAAAGLAAAAGHGERAAMLYGAVQARAQVAGIHRSAYDEAFLQPLVDQARRAMGADAFERACRRGAGQPFAQAGAELSAWLDTVPDLA